MFDEAFAAHRKWWLEEHADDPPIVPALMLVRGVSGVAKLLAHSYERDGKGKDWNGEVGERLGDMVLYCFSILHVRNETFRRHPTQFKFISAEEGMSVLVATVARNLQAVTFARGHEVGDVLHQVQMFANCCAIDIQQAVRRSLEKLK
jgi:NTP pyrophosphatase (non-canonical NTP hydrolase)